MAWPQLDDQFGQSINTLGTTNVNVVSERANKGTSDLAVMSQKSTRLGQ